MNVNVLFLLNSSIYNTLVDGFVKEFGWNSSIGIKPFKKSSESGDEKLVLYENGVNNHGDAQAHCSLIARTLPFSCVQQQPNMAVSVCLYYEELATYGIALQNPSNGMYFRKMAIDGEGNIQEGSDEILKSYTSIEEMWNHWVRKHSYQLIIITDKQHDVTKSFVADLIKAATENADPIEDVLVVNSKEIIRFYDNLENIKGWISYQMLGYGCVL